MRVLHTRYVAECEASLGSCVLRAAPRIRAIALVARAAKRVLNALTNAGWH